MNTPDPVVTDQISACVQAADGGLWCTTHESMMRGEVCTVMLDAEDLADAVRGKERERIVAMVTALIEEVMTAVDEDGQSGNYTARTIGLVRADAMREVVKTITEGAAK